MSARPRVLALVFGGRTFGVHAKVGVALAEQQRQALHAVLDEIRPHLVAHGGATGADSLAQAWADSEGARAWRLDAPWAIAGKAAGPMRNETLLRAVLHFAAQCERRKIEVQVVAVQCPGDDGTADMRRRVDAAGVRVVEVAP